MSWAHIGIMGGIGESMALVGLALIWTCREQALEWLREFVDIWRGHVTGRDPILADPVYRRLQPRRPAGAIWLVGAVGLVFIGQILFLIDLTF